MYIICNNWDAASCKLCGLSRKCNIVCRYILAVDIVHIVTVWVYSYTSKAMVYTP